MRSTVPMIIRTGQKSFLWKFVALCICLTTLICVSPQSAEASSNGLVISQVFGSGGRTDAPYQNDFVEIFNAGNTSQSLNGYSVQYANANADIWSVAVLPDVSLQAGQYFLIQLAVGAGNGVVLPSPDLVDTYPVSHQRGKFALVAQTEALSGLNVLSDSDLIDYVAWGTELVYQGTATATITDPNAIFRADAGCTDTDDASADFAQAAASPRNTSTTLNPCGGVSDDPPNVDTISPENNATDVALDSNLSVTFTESVALSTGWYTINCGTSGVHTAQVSGSGASYTLNPDTDFAFNETCTVTINAAQVVDEDGNADAMQSNYVWSFSTNSDVPPFVSSTTPATDAVDVALDAAIAVNFSESVTATDTWYSISCTKSGSVAATAGGGPQNYTISPNSDLAYDETCTVTIIAAQVEDSSNQTMAANKVWSFTTVSDGSGDVPPEVSSTLPNMDAVNVPPNANLVVTFSEAVTTTGSWFTISCGTSGGHSASFSGDGTTFVLDPTTDFTAEETCTVTIVAVQIADSNDNALQSNYVWSFTIVAEDSPIPYVPTYLPASGANNIPTDETISLSFDQSVIASAGWFSIICDNAGEISGTATGGPQNFVITPDTDLPSDDTCTITIDATKVTSLDGSSTPMALDNIWRFSTGTGDSTSEIPTVVSVTPENNTLVLKNIDVKVSFSENVAVTGTWYSLSCTASGDVVTSVQDGPKDYVIIPAQDFVPDETCTMTIFASQVQDFDAAPNNLSADYTWTFVIASPIGQCSANYTPIYTLQGTGLQTTASGVVTTEGVVTGDFEGGVPGTLGGFYIQDPTGDGDVSTSDGIFVYDTYQDLVSVGQHVRVQGTLSETFGQTRIDAPIDLVVCGTGSTITPVTVTLPFATATGAERYEGMLVNFTQKLVVIDHYDLARYGEITLATGRQFAPTQLEQPGEAATELANLNARSRIILDDNSNTVYDADPPYIIDNLTLRLGDTVTGLTGIIGEGFGAHRVYPTITPPLVSENPRPETPPDVGGFLKVMSFNLQNYFDGPFPTDRGADSEAEFIRQTEKLTETIDAVAPDILGVMELESGSEKFNSSSVALQDALSDRYAIVPLFPGDDAITVGMFYNTDEVQPVGDPATTYAAPFDIRRPPLAQTFEDITSGETFTVVVVHLKSRSCSEATGVQQDNGQGCWNVERTQAVQTLLDWLATDPTNSGDSDFLIIGDLNAYALEDPLKTFQQAGYTNVSPLFGAEYSYVFEGQSGTLDYAIASPSMLKHITGAAYWHINADEPRYLDYNLENKSAWEQALNVGTVYRSSDHDPLLVGLDMFDDDPVFTTNLELIYPTGTVTDGYGNPLYEWTRIEDATEYELYIAPADAITDYVYFDIFSAEERCRDASCTLDPTQWVESARLINGDYVVYLRVWKSYEEDSGWIGPYYFTLNAPPPQSVSFDGSISSQRSRIRAQWSAEGAAGYASWFNLGLTSLELEASDNVVWDTWYPRLDVCSGEGDAQCSLIVPVDLPEGRYTLTISSWGPGGFSTGQTEIPIFIDAEQPDPPGGVTVTTTSGRAVVEWELDENASWAEVNLTDAAGESLYSEWHYLWDGICGDVGCALTPDVHLPNGEYAVYMRTWGPGGLNRGGWQGPRAFKLNFAPPTVITGLTVTDVSDGNPDLTWRAVDNATWYHIWLGTSDFETNYDEWLYTGDVCESGLTCTRVPEIYLPNGSYSWYIQSWGPGGFSTGGIEGWKAGAPFNISVIPADPPTVNIPRLHYGTNDNDPEFNWVHQPSVTWYEVSINGPGLTYQNWLSAKELACTDVCLLEIPDLRFPKGTFTWSLRTYNAAGVGQPFTVDFVVYR